MMKYLFLAFLLLQFSAAWVLRHPRIVPTRHFSSIQPSANPALDLEDPDFEAEDPSVVVRCLATNRVIECFIDCTVEDNGVQYYVLHPCDEVVGIVKFDQAGVPDLIDPDSKEMDDLFPTASVLFAEDDDINLIRSATCLTMQGDFEDDDDEADDDDHGDGAREGLEAENDEDMDLEDEQECDNDGDEKVELLSDFEIEEVPYSLVKMMEPMFLVAKRASGVDAMVDDFELLSSAESSRIAPLVEVAIEKSCTI